MSNTYRRRKGDKFWKNNGGCWIHRVGNVTPKEADNYYKREIANWRGKANKYLKEAAHKDFRLQWHNQKIAIMQGNYDDYLNPVKAEYGDPWDWY